MSREGAPGSATVHLLTVTLRRVRPPVRRRLEVPSGITLGALSAVLTAAFGWDGDHLHQFEVRDSLYGPPELVEDPFGLPFGRAARDEGAAVLGQLLPRPGDVAGWTYDLGDEWQHRIEVGAVQSADPDVIYPRCTTGAGLAPVEDTGRARKGTFGAAQRDRLNAVLARDLGMPGRDLQVEQPGLGTLFSGIFPELDARAASDCDCEECAANGEDDPPTLPVLRPEPDEALAAAAAATPLAGRALALAGWIGSGRALTPAKLLRPAEAAQALAQLELDRPVLPPHRGADPEPFSRHADGLGARSSSAKNIPALHPIWCAAVAAGLIEVRGQRAVPGPGLALWQEPADPRRRLQGWAQLLSGYLRVLAETERADRSWYAGPQHPLLAMSVTMLYTAADGPLWPGVLAIGDLLLGDLEDLDPLDLLDLPEVAARWAEVLEHWAVAGVVAAADAQELDASGERNQDFAELMTQVGEALGEIGQAVPAAGDQLASVLRSVGTGPWAEVTPLGRHSLACVLRGHGLSVPTLGDLVDTPAGDLLEALYDHELDAAVEEARGWLAARGDAWEGALGDVMRSATVKDEAGPVRRSVLPAVIGVVGEAGAPMLEEWQADPWLKAPVAVGRFSAGLGPQPTLAQFLWMAVDVLSMGLDDEDDFTGLMDAVQVEAMLAEPGAIAAARDLDHPQAREVLQLLVGSLEDRDLARRLRKALNGRAVGTRRSSQTR